MLIFKIQNYLRSITTLNRKQVNRGNFLMNQIMIEDISRSLMYLISLSLCLLCSELQLMMRKSIGHLIGLIIIQQCILHQVL